MLREVWKMGTILGKTVTILYIMMLSKLSKRKPPCWSSLPACWNAHLNIGTYTAPHFKIRWTRRSWMDKKGRTVEETLCSHYTSSSASFPLDTKNMHRQHERHSLSSLKSLDCSELKEKILCSSRRAFWCNCCSKTKKVGIVPEIA